MQRGKKGERGREQRQERRERDGMDRTKKGTANRGGGRERGKQGDSREKPENVSRACAFIPVGGSLRLDTYPNPA